MSIVPVTEMPYADARLDDDLKPIARPMHDTSKNQFTSGM